MEVKWFVFAAGVAWGRVSTPEATSRTLLVMGSAFLSGRSGLCRLPLCFEGVRNACQAAGQAYFSLCTKAAVTALLSPSKERECGNPHGASKEFFFLLENENKQVFLMKLLLLFSLFIF